MNGPSEEYMRSSRKSHDDGTLCFVNENVVATLLNT